MYCRDESAMNFDVAFEKLIGHEGAAHRRQPDRRVMSYQELPMACRQCANRISQYLYPAWSHKCAKGKPMVDGCRWKQGRHQNFEEMQHAGNRDET